MYDVYRLKHAEQPSPRTLVGSFSKATDIRDQMKIDGEKVLRMIAGETVDGLQVERSYDFLRIAEPLRQDQIAEQLGISPLTVKKTVDNAFKRLRSAGLLKEFLELVRELRELESRRGNHGGHFEVEMTTTIKVSADAEE